MTTWDMAGSTPSNPSQFALYCVNGDGTWFYYTWVIQTQPARN